MSICVQWIPKTCNAREMEPYEKLKESAPATIGNIPDTVLTKIFSELKVSELKFNRLTCKFWNTTICESGILAKQTSAVVFRGKPSIDKLENSKLLNVGPYVVLLNNWFVDKLSLHGNTFRIQNTSDGVYAFLFCHRLKLQKVTSLELMSANFSVKELLRIISQHFTKLESILINDSTFGDHNKHDVQKLAKFNRKWIFKHLKKLEIYFSHVWAHVDFSLPKFLVDNVSICCLESLTIKVRDCGSSFADRRGHYQRIFKSIGLILKNNAGTLKTFDLSTFNETVSRNSRSFINSNINPRNIITEIPTEDQKFIFDCFLQEMTDSRWIDFGLKLENLSLEFRLILLDKCNSLFENTFKPFLKSLTILRKISILQIYTQDGGYFDEVFGIFFGCCDCDFIEVYSILPQQLEENLQGLMLFYLTQVLAGNSVLEDLKEQFRQFIRPSVGDFRTTLAVNNLRWVMRFPSWKSLLAVRFFQKHLEFLTRIRIDHSCAVFTHKLRVKDEDLQIIIRSAPALYELLFLYCNLTEVTDFGLTGIRSGICALMSTHGNYDKLDAADVIGLPLSNLKHLRSLALCQVGIHVTDVSAFHAFNGLEKLNYFKIKYHNFTDSATEALIKKFEFNIRLDLSLLNSWKYSSQNSDILI